MTASSEHFSPRQLRGLEKVGNRMLPADGDEPSFGQLGCIERADLVVEHLPPHDRSDLLMLFGLLALLPGVLVGAVLWLVERGGRLPGGLGSLLRMASLGLKGIVMTLYYSDDAVLDRMGYELQVVTDDMRPRAGTPD